ncbi:MAG: ankyrin repeat domain-containing protein [Alphaproteobacteria bacterium]|nr:MAG: ankyrin repeat domain-containing protein [Alphaproteobacteria bacterium]
MATPYQPTPEDVEWRDSLRKLPKDKLNDSLCDAVSAGSVWRVQEALSAGANARGNGGQPIRKAAVSGHLQIAVLLTDAGADLHINGEEPLCWAARDGNAALVEFFLSRGADEKSWGGRRARDWAADYKQPSSLFLLDHAAELRENKAKTGSGLAEKAMQDIENGAPLPMADIKKNDAFSDIYIYALADAGKLDLLFEPKSWLGDIDGMKQLWTRLPRKCQDHIDLSEKTAAVKREALKSAKIPKMKW